MKKIVTVIFLIVTLFFLFPGSIKAQDLSCPNRYLTLVNPIRGMGLWSDKNINVLKSQSQSAEKFGLPVTWLLQYDALSDNEVVNTLGDFKKDEKGIFLEVSKFLAESAAVSYPEGLRWSDPGAVFLSAYSQSERRRLIDTLYLKFKEDFGYYPKSVGAWWIDSYSLTYINEKYGLSSVLIVADQKITDSYGVWGQWWGYPYYPSKDNVLVPATVGFGPVVIQWAQRDPIRAYGIGSEYSNFSLQANDYIRNGEGTDYFKKLVTTYLDCKNPLGQITIGMETGMEGAAFQKEYDNQLSYLSTINGLKAVTMADFSDKFKGVYKKNPSDVKIGNWVLNRRGRENNLLGDLVKYNPNISFSDYFVADKNNFLNRSLTDNIPQSSGNYFPWFLLVAFVFGAFASSKREILAFGSILAFTLCSLMLVFSSGVFKGWEVFYGPYFKDIALYQVVVLMVAFAILWPLYLLVKDKVKDIKLLFFLLPLSFGIDGIVSFFRYSKISGSSFLGILYANTHLIGLGFGKGLINVISERLPLINVSSFMKFPFDKVWSSSVLYVLVYPIFHLFLAVSIFLALKRVSQRVKSIILAFLLLFFIMYLGWVSGFDPRLVLPIGS